VIAKKNVMELMEVTEMVAKVEEAKGQSTGIDS
jgi:hypothetical protein